MYRHIVRPTLFALTKRDPEDAHVFTLWALKKLQAHPIALTWVELLYQAQHNPHPVIVSGITFPNRVGLAAGFDKNAEALLALQAMGFGFIEVGSVLPYPQKGNDQPRMFRFPKHQALLNRMGFNSAGVLEVEANIQKVWPRIRIPLGISLGKMKNTADVDAELDYLPTFRQLYTSASYGVLNVSSPNTPGLRDLQQKNRIEKLVRNTVEAGKVMAREKEKETVPVFVKLAPDLTDQQFLDTIEGCEQGGASGYIIANTSISPAIKETLGTTEMGGVSGAPVRKRALELVRKLRVMLPKTTIVGVGGTMNRDHGSMMFGAGADLIEILAGFVYRGPRLVQQLRAIQ